MANILAVGTSSIPDTPGLMTGVVFAAAGIAITPFLITALGVYSANAAKNAILNNIGKIGLDEQTSLMINYILEEIQDLFSNTDEPNCLEDYKKTEDKNTLITVLKQAYSRRKIKDDSYDYNENSLFDLLNNRNKLIKKILKIFGYNYIATVSVLKDKQIYAKLVDKFNQIKQNYPSCAEKFKNKCFSKPVNMVVKDEKEKSLMKYTGNVTNDLATYTTFNLTQAEVEYFQNYTSKKNQDPNKKPPIITLDDLWKNYEEKMEYIHDIKNHITNKLPKIKKEEYEIYYKKFETYLINSKRDMDGSNIIYFIDRWVSDTNPLRKVIPILYGQNISSITDKNVMNIFKFFFYTPPIQDDLGKIPVYIKLKENGKVKYSDTTRKVNPPVRDKDSDYYLNGYWIWNPKSGYKLKPCNGNDKDYIYEIGEDNQIYCIDKPNTEYQEEKDKNPRYKASIIKLYDLISNYIDKNSKDKTKWNEFIKKIYGGNYPEYIITESSSLTNDIRLELIRQIVNKHPENYEENYKTFIDVLNKTFKDRYITNNQKLDTNTIEKSMKDLLTEPKGISSEEFKKVLSILYGSEITTQVNYQDLFNFFFYPPPTDDHEIDIYTKDTETNEDKVSETIKSNIWEWTPSDGYKYSNCGDNTKYTYFDYTCISEKDYKLFELSYQKKLEENNQKNLKKNRYREPVYQTQTKNRLKKKIEFTDKVANVIAELQNKIGKMKNTPLCDDCNQKFEKIGKMTIDDIRAYLKEKKPCLCKNHITEFMEKIIQEKKAKGKKGGTQKRRRTSKGGSLSLEQNTTNHLIEEIHEIDGSRSLNENKPHFATIIGLLNGMIHNQIPLDMHYTGNASNIGQDDRILRAILYSYSIQLPKVQEADREKFEKIYIELFTIFLIGFINNLEINNQEGYDPIFDLEHSIHYMIDLICNHPKYVHLKDRIMQHMHDMMKNPKVHEAIKETVQKILNSDIFKELCSPIKYTDAIPQRPPGLTEQQKKRWNRTLRRFWNSRHSRRKTKNPNVTRASQVKYPIYGIDGLTLIHPTGTLDNRNTGLPFVNHDQPDRQQIMRQRRRSVNKEIEDLRYSSKVLRSSSSRGGTKKQNKKRKRKTRKIV